MYHLHGGKVRFVVCSDNERAINAFASRLPSNTFIAPVSERKTKNNEYNHIMDMALLIGADMRLLTHRSTYSMTCGHRINQPSWYIEKESPYILHQRNSQVMFYDPLMHKDDICLGQTNMHVHMESNNDKLIEYMFNNLAI